MRLLLDQGLPRSACPLFEPQGHECAHVGDLDLARATDLAILRRAREAGYVVVTLDADFHARLATSRATRPSVIRLRMEGLRAEALVSLVCGVIARCRDDLSKGALVTVTPSRVSVRLLPIGS